MKITFYYPGAFFSESTVIEIEKIEDIKVPEYAFCFEIEGTKGRHYFGKEYTKDDVVAEAKVTGKDCHILISNMECNGYKRVVKCRTGNWQPLEKDDTVFGTGDTFTRYLKLKKIERLS